MLRHLILLPLLLLCLVDPHHTLHLAHAQCTLTTFNNGLQARLNNTLVALTLDTATATATSLIYYPGGSASSTQAPVDLLANGYANFDRTTDALTAPSRLRLWTIAQNSTFIHIKLRQVSTDTVRNLANFNWEFNFAIKAGLPGIYQWVTIYHGPEHLNDTVGVLRYIMRLNTGDAPNYSNAPLTHLWIPPNILRQQPTYPQAQSAEVLWPQEAARYMDSNGEAQVTYKYDYQLDNRFHDAVGWLNPSSKLGLWLLTPSYEYKNGGPDSQSLSSAGGTYFSHMQVVNSPHYGAGDQLLKDGETWYKVYGPWLIYANKKSNVQADVDDAYRQLRDEQALWPYSFVPDTFYKAENRFTISGRAVVSDSGGCPGATASWVASTRATLGLTWSKTLVFLTAPEATEGDYTQQSKGYMYWTYADDNGNFQFTKVVAGTYEIHVSVDGIIDEYVSPNLVTLNTATASRAADVGTLSFLATRNAPTLFQIGFPDRTAREYYHGDDWRHWGLFDQFPNDFPNGINYQVGSTCLQQPSQWRTQWNYAHLASYGNTTNDWRVTFNVPVNRTLGTYAYLRVAVAGAVRCSFVAKLNGQQIGLVNTLPKNDGSTYRSGVHGVYTVRVVRFATSRFVRTPSQNVLTLGNTCTARGFGIQYDAIQMEVEGWSW